MRSLLTTILIAIISHGSLGAASSQALESALHRLDSCLAIAHTFDKVKEDRIAMLQAQLQRATASSSQYDVCIQLYNEYRSYKYDSAFVYASRCMDIALAGHNAEQQLEAGCAVVFCQSSAGLYKEAFDSFEQIPAPTLLGDKYKSIYYETGARLNYDISDYNHSAPYQAKYVTQGDIYTDSLLTLIDNKSPEWWMVTGRRQMKQRNYEAALATFKKFLDLEKTDQHARAIALSSLGWMSSFNNDQQQTRVYLAEASMCDLMSSTKEITALALLAELLYEDGDVHRATSYVQIALQSAVFYGARQRQIEVGNILPIIEEGRNEILTRQRNVFITFTVVCLLLLAVITYLCVLALRRSRKLHEANDTIGRNIDQLAQTNAVVEQKNHILAQTNAQLQEANKIKAEYIANSLYINAMYIENMEKLYQMVSHKILAKQYNELLAAMSLSELKKERGNMFAHFDRTFLKIFPHFIERYNELFPPEEQIPDNGEFTLTTERRIFALIRLGITDSERIARFLNKSVHTINNYKTRVKNKSLVKNEDFEALIMAIDNDALATGQPPEKK